MADSPAGVGRADSVTSNDSQNKQTEKKKSRRPANTAFRQQRLKAWQPILTPKTVLPLFFGIGIIFAPIGGLLLYASSQVQELRIDYTNCYTDAPLGGNDTDLALMPADNVFSAFKSKDRKVNAQWRRENVNVTYAPGVVVKNTPKCVLQFTIPEEMGPPVLFYYRLNNFYQNHRRYVNSFYDKQLLGDDVTGSQVNDSNCEPLTAAPDGRAYYPCGLIANSLFNDSFTNPLLLNPGKTPERDNGDPEKYVMQNNSNIAWKSDKELYGKTKYKNYTLIAPPPNWVKRFPGPNGTEYGAYTDDNPPPDLSQDEAFMVWMRTAGLPAFSKLAQRNDTHAMKAGDYQLEILHNFNADAYKGTKEIVLTTRTVMGGRNPFLGIAYVVVGGMCIVLGAIFTVTHLIKPRKLGDHTYLSWNNAPGGSKQAAGSSTAVATGRDFGRPGEA